MVLALRENCEEVSFKFFEHGCTFTWVLYCNEDGAENDEASKEKNREGVKHGRKRVDIVNDCLSTFFRMYCLLVH